MNETEKKFENEISSTLDRLKTLLIEKGEEYRRNNDPFHNFKIGAEITGKLPEEVLQGFLLKHLISVDDIRNDLKLGILPTKEKVNEKYDDILVCFLIEKTMILKRIDDK